MKAEGVLILCRNHLDVEIQTDNNQFLTTSTQDY